MKTAVSCLAVVVVAVSASGSAARPDRTGRAVQPKLIDCTCYDVFSVRPSGHGRRLLLKNDGQNLLDVSVTRGGILYNKEVDSLYRATLRGSHARRISTVGVPAARWSPDGKLLAFITWTTDVCGQGMLNVLAPETGSIRSVAQCASSPAVWSPDSRRILFVEGASSTDPFGQLRILDLATARARTLASPHGSVGSAAWSPQGGRIAFVAYSKRGPRIHVIRSDGTKEIDVARGWDPVWSPDGRRLAFIYDRRGTHGVLAVMKADGSATNVLDRHGIAPYGQGISWSPNGRLLAYAHELTPDPTHMNLAVIRADGTHRRFVARGVVNEEYGPTYWSPDARTLFYTRYVQFGE